MRRDFTIYKRKDKKVYYYTTYINGKRIFRSTGKKTKVEAILFCQNKLQNGTLAYAGINNKTFGEFAEGFFDLNSEYINKQKEMGRQIGEPARISYQAILRNVVFPYFQKFLLTDITPKVIQQWLVEIKGKSTLTKKNYFLVLKVILREAIYKNYIQFNPCLGVQLPKIKINQRGCFTRDQIKQLFSIDWGDKEDIKLMCKLSAITGMRLNEIRALKKENIKENYILVNSSIENSTYRIKPPKNGKSRVVPITKEMKEELLKQPEGKEGFIFKWSKSRIRHTLNKYLKICNLDNLRLCFHSFRHFFNSQLVLSDVKSEIIRKVIGHESEEMTEHYLHIQPSELQEINKIQSEILK